MTGGMLCNVGVKRILAPEIIDYKSIDILDDALVQIQKYFGISWKGRG
jgi:hypothetical protein